MNRKYDIFINENSPRKYKLRQLVLYHIKDTDKYIMEKWGMIGNDLRRLIKAYYKIMKLKNIAPKVFKYPIYDYNLGMDYMINEEEKEITFGHIIGHIELITDKIEFVNENELDNYKLYSSACLKYDDVFKIMTLSKGDSHE